MVGQFAQTMNDRYRARLVSALELRLRAAGQQITEADIAKVEQFAKRWSADEVTWVEAWLRASSPAVF